jgi:hypothetical protein
VTVSVSALASTLAVRPVAGATYGRTWTLTAEVAGAGAAPTGEVTFTARGAALGAATVVDGVASLTVPRTRVAPGAVPVVASYAGDAAHAPAEARATVRVAKAPAAVAATLRRTRVRSGTPGLLVVKVSDGVPTTGKVAVWGAGRRLTATLPPAKDGSVWIAVRGLRPGTYRLRAHYGGSSLVAPATSPRVTLVVTR